MKGQLPLFALIAVVIVIVYIFFLPYPEKCKYLPDLEKCKGIETSVFKAVNISSFNPGLLEQYPSFSYYDFGKAELFTVEEIDIATIFENTKTSQGWIYSQKQEESFVSYGDAKEAKVFVMISEARGWLGVYFNGRKIGTAMNAGAFVFSVPEDKIKPINTITLRSLMPVLPWIVNEHRIAKVAVKEVYDTTQSIYAQNFTIEQNLSQIKKAKLSFDSRCFTPDNLAVKLNNAKIFEGVLCTSLEKYVNLTKKENILEISSQGDYLISDISLQLEMEKKEYPVYYFNIKKDILDRIHERKGIVMIKLGFDSKESRNFTIYVNGLAINGESKETEWKTSINDLIVEGQNWARIVPQETMTVNKLDIYAE